MPNVVTILIYSFQVWRLTVEVEGILSLQKTSRVCSNYNVLNVGNY